MPQEQQAKWIKTRWRKWGTSQSIAGCRIKCSTLLMRWIPLRSTPTGAIYCKGKRRLNNITLNWMPGYRTPTITRTYNRHGDISSRGLNKMQGHDPWSSMIKAISLWDSRMSRGLSIHGLLPADNWIRNNLPELIVLRAASKVWWETPGSKKTSQVS